MKHLLTIFIMIIGGLALIFIPYFIGLSLTIIPYFSENNIFEIKFICWFFGLVISGLLFFAFCFLKLIYDTIYDIEIKIESPLAKKIFKGKEKFKSNNQGGELSFFDYEGEIIEKGIK